mmetsp:Transcript_30955/g.51155  ORF Transcript_30955/g.51155 Transcript_30955/m.51155 type:complete len:243 (-) Transcript_30955:253-981(-)
MRLRRLSNRLRLTFRHSNGHDFGCLRLIAHLDQITFRLVLKCNLDSLRCECSSLLISLRPQDVFSSIAFGSRLLVHGTANLWIGHDFRNFIALHFEAPWDSSFLETALNDGIEAGATVQNFVQLHFSNGRSHGRLSVLSDAVDWIKGSVGCLLGVHKLNKQVTRHFDRYIVSRNRRLGRNINGSFTHIHHVRNRIHHGNSQKPTGILNDMKLSKSFHDVLVSLRDNVEDGIGFPYGPSIRCC